MFEEHKEKATQKMQDNIEAFRTKARKIRTGRAHPALLESIQVLYYGRMTPVSQMANISSPAPRSLLVNPWDTGALKDIEQALVRANLGVTPQNDGKAIRLTLPELTEERRRDLVKEVKKMAEKCRVDLRNNRRAVNEDIKNAVKEKALSEDDQKRLNSEIQKITDDFIKQADQILQAKEKEIMDF